MNSDISVVVLAAGLGTRMKSARPKVLHALAGRPMIGHVMATLEKLAPKRVVLVVGPGMDAVTDAARAAAPGLDIASVVQAERRGTGHAVLMAKPALSGCSGDVLVVFGDTPLLQAATLRDMVERRRASGAAVAVLGMRRRDPGMYGRLVVAPDGGLERIVEAKDASEAERAITLCNAGAMAIDGSRLFALLDQVRPRNAQGEYYLTDVVGLARAAGLTCTHAEGDAGDLIGVDSRALLAEAEATFQKRARANAMTNGATLIDPATVWFSYDTELGRDVVIGPMVVFGPGVKVADGVEIKGFCHIEGAEIREGAQIGPFARLRPGAEIGREAHIGNFVEIKAARVEAGAKVNHLSYVGDARVGAKANVGAGTITCNYDGFVKSFTDIGAGAFIGSNTALVAPVKVGAGAIIAAGSVITADVADDALAVARGEQVEKPGWAGAYRAAKAAKKAKAVAAKTKRSG